MKGTILAVCVSEKKGEQKHPVEEIRLVPQVGIPGDAHAGDWHRMLSLLSANSVRRLQEKVSIPLLPGAFAENVLVDGMDVHTLPVGARIMVGSALCEVTQIGKECHADCAIRRQAGDCVMPREGIFARVLTEGTAKPGDTVAVLREDIDGD